jgi:pimeloyl-ACP methyl ester carboxylesterase
VLEITPADQTDPVPLVVAPGWGQTERSLIVPLRVFARRGRRVLTLTRPGRGAAIRGETDLPTEPVRKMQALIGGLSRLGIDRVDLVAHSEGALTAMLAAALYPRRVRGLVLLDPAGLIADDRYHHLAGRFLMMQAQCVAEGVRHPALLPGLVQATVGLLSFVATHPTRALGQLRALATWDAVDALRVAVDAGVGVIVIEGVDNQIFPLVRRGALVRDGRPLLDGYYSVRGGHATFLGDPRHAEAVVDALALLRAHKRGSAAEQHGDQHEHQSNAEQRQAGNHERPDGVLRPAIARNEQQADR